MALTIGTNCGFVTVAPSADPGGMAAVIDNWYSAVKDTSPAELTQITEVGWWCDNATEETNFEVGLYSHDADNNKPGNRLYVSNTNAKGITSGWKSSAVSWEITPETIYWIAIQVDNTATQTNQDWGAAVGYRFSQKSAQSTLTDPWSATSSQTADNTLGTYAVVTTGGTPVEISGTIAGISSLSGVLTVFDSTALTGTIAATSTLSGSLTLSSNWQTENMVTIKRLVAIGNDSFFYEDI